MAVASMTLRFHAPRRRPRIGDRKQSKDGTVLVRRQVYTQVAGQWYGLIRGSKPICEWVPEGTPNPWEVTP